MKIFYGVQGTGNGHLSRARAMCRAFRKIPNVEVQWMFSGRNPDAFFEMDDFGDYQLRRGLTFFSEKGRIQNLKTLFCNHPWQFLKDRKQLNLKDFDLIVSDYEPVTAWAAKRFQVPAIGLGHQYAFNYPVPDSGGNPVTRMVMQKFAPMPKVLGLHWHHFNQPILPPILDLDHFHPTPVVAGKVLVYLPFEDASELLQKLKRYSGFDFYVYAPGLNDVDDGYIHCRKICREGFKNDLADAERVVCNAGFELISEALQLGKTILAKPLSGQMEQISNALAIEQLGLAKTTRKLDNDVLGTWLNAEMKGIKVDYPDVAAAIAQWLVDSAEEPVAELSQKLWSETTGLPEWYAT